MARIMKKGWVHKAQDKAIAFRDSIRKEVKGDFMFALLIATCIFLVLGVVVSSLVGLTIAMIHMQWWGYALMFGVVLPIGGLTYHFSRPIRVARTSDATLATEAANRRIVEARRVPVLNAPLNPTYWLTQGTTTGNLIPQVFPHQQRDVIMETYRQQLLNNQIYHAATTNRIVVETDQGGAATYYLDE